MAGERYRTAAGPASLSGIALALPKSMHMVLQTFRFLSLVLAGIAFGPAFSHLLEMPVKLNLPPSDYVIVQQIYTAFGVVGAIVEPAAIVSAGVLAFLVRGRRAFRPALVGALCLVASLLIWVAIVNPVSASWQTASPSMLPESFSSLRMRWELGHATRALLHFGAFVSLILAVLADMSAVAAAAVKLTVPKATTTNAEAEKTAASDENAADRGAAA